MLTSETHIEACNTSPANLNYLLLTSNYIRGKLLDCLINDAISLEDCYTEIHKAHFKDKEKALGIDSNDMHRKHDTELPVRIHDSLTLPIPVSLLTKIKSEFFSTIEKSDWEGDFLDYITIVDMMLRICHIPHDGAGRSNEDFIVLYGLRNGRKFTFSEDGYRGQLNDASLVHKRSNEQNKTLLNEIGKIDSIENVSLAQKEMVCLENIKDPQKVLVKKISKDSGFIEFQLKKVNIGLMLLEALKNPNSSLPFIKETFPESFTLFKETFLEAEKQEYKYL